MFNVKSKTVAPGPQGITFPKNLIGFYRDPIGLFAQLHERYGDIVRLQGGPYYAHLLTKPEHIKHVLQDNAKNYRLSGIFDETVPVVGRGLTTNNGQSWLKQRRMVQVPFNHKYIPAYGDIIVSVVEEELAKWSEHAKLGKSINIDAEVLKINLHILGKLLFSIDFNENDPLWAALGLVRKESIEHARSIIRFPSSNHQFMDAVNTLDKFTYGQIAERRNGTSHTDILSMLMEAKDTETGYSMTNTELHDEIMTLLFAAYEDVANALAWTWYLLTQNPEAESKLRAEIGNVLGDHPPTASDLRNMPNLSMTVNEVLRLYPTTWSLLREAIKDDEIGGFHIPANSTMMFDLYLTHRLPEYWDNPEHFDPERFSPERFVGKPRFAYFPFGGGPRQCIGNELALMEIKLILVRMIQLYRFTPISKVPVQINALSSLQPRGGVWMKVQNANL